MTPTLAQLIRTAAKLSWRGSFVLELCQTGQWCASGSDAVGHPMLLRYGRSPRAAVAKLVRALRESKEAKRD